jgi:osmotically inducible lipoprotein OsmB
MRTTYGGALTLGALLLLSACGSNTEQRAATGGLGGMAAGALIGGPVGAVAGAAVGAGAGTAVSKGTEHNEQSKTASDQTGATTPLAHPAEQNPSAPTSAQ